MQKPKLITLLFVLACCLNANAGERFNFNAGWLMKMGANDDASAVAFDDTKWQKVTLPYSYNQTEAFAKPIDQLTDTVAWYRKHFVLPEELRNAEKFFIEFEGVRFGAHVYLNGKELGWGDNGIMAFGFDLTPYINKTGENVLAVFVDNNWHYREHKKGLNPKNGKMTYSGFQWNDKNFFCNYGGINKNVWLHVMHSNVYQTLPLYSNLGTTGVYVYATNHDVARGKAVINTESEVRNDGREPKAIGYRVVMTDPEGHQVAAFKGLEQTVMPGSSVTMRASCAVEGLHFWSWGYGYLYDVRTIITENGKPIDETTTRTGFRKTEYKDGMVWLNDRVIQLKGFAQRSTNEWPAVGICIPAWMSDLSNRMVLECNGNLVRWMHVTPMKQDIESFDRLGLIQAMPAGDSEKDVFDRRWTQRLEVMRDAIIYNRNNPSILFYECGNNQISEEHMAEMKLIRNHYDPHGGRAIGSRNMLDSREAEYGGEMLYVNKSTTKPMWMMEYCRNEGVRRYWDEWSWPYHKEGDGPLYRGEVARSYNHNQDRFALENVVRWNEYWLARPGQGKRVNSGGAKIIFSDSNTHFRGEKNYRTSGDVDAMRLPKDSYFAHQVMWDGWVDTEKHHTHIVGHWTYEPGTKKPVYVVSTGDEVELLLNGKSLGKGKRRDTFFFTFEGVKYQPGTLVAISSEGGVETSRDTLHTAGKAARIAMKWVDAPELFRADGADIRIAEVEIVDAHGRRCPTAHDLLTFSLQGEGEWLGGLSGVTADSLDNRVLNKKLYIEAGVCRVMVRSTTKAGNIRLQARAKGFKTSTLSIATTSTPVSNGFFVDNAGKAIEAAWGEELPAYMERGATPSTPSFRQHLATVDIAQISSPSDTTGIWSVCDDNEASKWLSDGYLQNSKVTFRLAKKAAISQVAIRLDGFRRTSYPIEIIAEGSAPKVVWSGYTDKSLGYAYCQIANPVEADTYTIRMLGTATVQEAFGDLTELAAKQPVSKKASKSDRLGIIEIEFKEKNQ